jgi:hypothetical protein
VPGLAPHMQSCAMWQKTRHDFGRFTDATNSCSLLYFKTGATGIGARRIGPDAISNVLGGRFVELTARLGR